MPLPRLAVGCLRLRPVSRYVGWAIRMIHYVYGSASPTVFTLPVRAFQRRGHRYEAADPGGPGSSPAGGALSEQDKTPNVPREEALAHEQALVQEQIEAASARLDQATTAMAQADTDLAAARTQQRASQDRVTNLRAELRAANAAALSITDTLAHRRQQEQIEEIVQSLAQARSQHRHAAEKSARLVSATQKSHHQAEQLYTQAHRLLDDLNRCLDQLQGQRALAHTLIGRTKLAELKAALAARRLAVQEAQLVLEEATRALEQLERSATDLLAEWPEFQEEVQRLLPPPPELPPPATREATRAEEDGS